MLSTCPSCGHDLDVQPLHVDLDHNVVFNGERCAKVASSEAELLATLIKRSPAVVRLDTLYNSLWGWPDAWPVTYPNILKVHISSMRPKLASIGVNVECVWGRGYRIPTPVHH